MRLDSRCPQVSSMLQTSSTHNSEFNKSKTTVRNLFLYESVRYQSRKTVKEENDKELTIRSILMVVQTVYSSLNFQQLASIWTHFPVLHRKMLRKQKEPPEYVYISEYITDPENMTLTKRDLPDRVYPRYPKCASTLHKTQNKGMQQKSRFQIALSPWYIRWVQKSKERYLRDRGYLSWPMRFLALLRTQYQQT